jgi:hypothetical protein
MDEYCGHDVIVINGGWRAWFWFTHAGYEFDIGLRYGSEPPAQRVTSGRWVSTWNSASSTRPGCCGYSGPIAGPQAAEPEPDGHVPT